MSNAHNESDQDDKYEELMQSVHSGNYIAAKNLLNNGAQFRRMTMHGVAGSKEYGAEALKFMIENNAPKGEVRMRTFSNTILHAGAKCNDFEKVKYLLEHGFSHEIDERNRNDYTPLGYCVETNGKQTDKRIIELIVLKGDDLNDAYFTSGLSGDHRESSYKLIEKYFGGEYLLKLRKIILSRKM